MNKHEIEQLLSALKIPATCIDIRESVFYIDYYLSFKLGVTLRKIRSNIENIAFYMHTEGITFEDNGHCTVLHVPKASQRPTIHFGGYSQMVKDSDKALPFLAGIDANGKPVISDLAKMPHLLVAGATGSGKSVFLNTLILSLLLKGETTLVLIDCKRVELNIYNGMCCLESINNDHKIVDNFDDAVKTLNGVCYFMDERYKKMSQEGCRDFDEYKAKHPNECRMTVVIDELADLMSNKDTRKAIEKAIVRIGSLGRASGIHLVVATQRPSVDVVSGIIKANIPSRMAFAVASRTDSHTILDSNGAEQLLGNGDALFQPIGSRNPIRLQATYVSTESVIDFVGRYIA